MQTRVLLIALAALLTTSCGGGDKHLPSSNPPEYDPKKVYSSTSSTPTQSAPQLAKPEPQATPPPPPMDPEALRQALETADRTRAILKKGAALDSKAEIHAILEAMMLGEQAPPELRPTFRESFETRKAQIHQAFDKQHKQFQQALDEEHKLPATQPPLRKSDGSEPFSLYRVNGGGVRGAHVPWVHPVGLSLGVTVSLEPDCCGAWHIATIPDSAFEGDGFGLEIKSGGRYWPDNDHIGEGDAMTTTIKVVAGDKATIKVKILNKNRGVVSRCPSASGAVPGDASIYEEMGYSVSTPATNGSAGIFVHDQAKTEAQTDEEGLVQEIKMDITAADLDGETGQVLRHASGKAVKKRDMPVSCSGCNARVAEAAKRLAGISSWNYYNAELKWRKPSFSADACVKIHFTPATKTVELSSGSSTKVKAELRTVKEDQSTDGRVFEVREIHDGRVTPKESKTRSGSPAVFTFTAPRKAGTKSEIPGFRILNSSSKAGRAWQEDWEVKLGRYVLEFQSRIVDREPTAPAESVAAGRVTLTLVEGKDMYRGSGMLGYQTGPPPNRDPCTSLIMGHGTTRLDVAGMFIKLSERTDAAGNQIGSADIELHYLIHPTNETERLHTMVNYQCVPGELVPNPFFYSLYAVSRGAEEINLLKGWTYVGRNGVVATKTLHGNCGDHCEDVTVFTLKEGE
ncbi:MAG: hypothetical protein E8D50_05300 [Nitrospira sp.]|nr:MAG: hypothetical protein E8D50_05300 [Nitrospira sp.]